MIIMNAETTKRIREFSTDGKQSNSLLALMDWCEVTNLASVSEEQGQQFLDMLIAGEVKMPMVYDYKMLDFCCFCRKKYCDLCVF